MRPFFVSKRAAVLPVSFSFQKLPYRWLRPSKSATLLYCQQREMGTVHLFLKDVTKNSPGGSCSLAGPVPVTRSDNKR